MRRLVISSDRNPVVHLELHTGDLAGARALYSQLCGWPHSLVRDRCGTYLALELGGGLGGGIVECPTRRAVWLPYVEVSDIQRATEQAQRHGAAVLLGPRARVSSPTSSTTCPSTSSPRRSRAPRGATRPCSAATSSRMSPSSSTRSAGRSSSTAAASSRAACSSSTSSTSCA